MQYLALRTIFNAEIARRDDRDLAKVIKTLVDDPVDYDVDGNWESTTAYPAVPEMGSDAVDVDDGNATVTASRSDDADRTSVEAANKKVKPLSTAMQMLTVITGVLASGAAAGLITYLMFPGNSGNNAR